MIIITRRIGLGGDRTQFSLLPAGTERPVEALGLDRRLEA